MPSGAMPSPWAVAASRLPEVFLSMPSMLRIRACLLLALLVAAPAFALEPVTLQLKWRNAFQFAGYYTALWKGYYRDAGFDVTIKEAEPGQNVVDEVVAGRAQFGVGTSSLLLAWHGGKPVVVLGVIFQHSPYVVVARQDAGIGSIHDIVDKRLMLEPLSDEILAYLQREGIPMNRVKRLEHTFRVEDLIDGRTDAIAAYVTNQPFHLRRAGVPYHVFSPRSAGVDFYGDNLFTSKGLLERQPDRAQAFRDASLRGWEYAMAHPDEIAALILERINTQGLSADYLRFEAAQMRELLQPNLVQLGYMHPGRWRHIADTYAEIGMLPPGIDLKGFIYAPDPEASLAWLYRVLGIGFLVLVLAGGISLYVLHINRRLQASLAEVRAAHDRLQVLSTAIEQSPTGVIVTDAEKRIQYVNPHFCAISGFDSAEAIGQLPNMVSSGQNSPDTYRAMWDALNHGQPWSGELLNKRKSGKMYWEEVHIAPVRDEQGATTHYVAVKLDVDARKQAEAKATRLIEELTRANAELKLLNERLEDTKGQLEQSEKMAAIGQLAAGVAHEINNPIGFVRSNLGALAEYVEGLLSVIDAYARAEPALAAHPALLDDVAQAKAAADLPFLREDVGVLIRESREGVDRVRKIVENLREFTRLDGADWQHFNLERGLDSTLRILENELRGKAEVVREYAGLPDVECIAAQINQVFINLIANAVQAIPERGVITLRTGQAGDSVWVEIADDGVGIAPENLQRVFEPFFTTKPVGKGTGLGLSLAYGIVRQHGGNLAVNSEPGRGATFRVTLPRTREQR